MSDFHEEYEDGDDDEQFYEQCSCRFCVCMNRTEYGDICCDCGSGAHQG